MTGANRTVLVTGGAGFIGSHTCKRLAQRGWLPVSYDNLRTGHAASVRWGPLERGDILDPARLAAVLATHRPAALVHCAGAAYVGDSSVDPATYYETNVAGSLVLLNAARQAGVDRVIFSSSCAVYGESEGGTLDETHPKAPISPYGFTKLAVERMLQDFQAAYGLRCIALRYFNAAGADPQGELGEDHDPETHLIPLVIKAGLGLAPPITVFGRDYATPDGTCVRDFIHVTDLASGHVLALERLAGDTSDRGSAAFNLGTGQGFSVQTIINRVSDLLGRRVPTRDSVRRPGDPAVLLATPARARTELGWAPEHSRLDTILHTALAWFRRRAASEVAAVDL